MNLNYELSEQDELAAIQAVGDKIKYCVPADLSLTGRRMNGFFVIGETRWAYIQNGQVQESCLIADGHDYKIIPLVGNAILEAVWNSTGAPRIIIRLSMQHVARYGYIAQILNYISQSQTIRLYNNEEEFVCVNCGGHLIQGTRIC